MATQRMECTQVGSVLTFVMPNGSTVVFDADKVSTEIRSQAMYHGFRQKIADAAAIQWRRPDGTTRAPTWAEKREKMQGVVDNLYDNVWRAAAEGGVSLFVQAVLEWPKVAGKFADAAAVREWIKRAADERKASPAAVQKSMLATFADLKAIHDRLSAANVDTELAEDLMEEIVNL